MSATSVSEIAIKLGLDDASMVAGLSRAKTHVKGWASDMSNTAFFSAMTGGPDLGKIAADKAKNVADTLSSRTSEKQALTELLSLIKSTYSETDRLLALNIRLKQDYEAFNATLEKANLTSAERNKLTNDFIEAQNRIRSQAEGPSRQTLENEAKREAIMLLKDAEGETNKLLKLDTRLRQEAMEFKKVLDAANLSLTERNAIVQRFLAAQAAIRKEATGLSPQELALQKRDNDLKRDAIALKNLIASAEQRHTIRLAEYNEMLKATLITQEEYDRAVQHSLMVKDASAKGFGAMSGAMTQASFAAEDFIQVLSMGGGLNMALMSASNNLSMVARALAPTSGAIGALVGVGIPALLISLGMAATHFLKTKDAVEELKKAMEEVNDRFKDFGKMSQLRLKIQFNTEDIKAISELNALEEQRTALLREEKQLKVVLLKQDMERGAKNRAAFESLLGGEDALNELRNYLHRAISQGTDEQVEAAKKLSKLLSQAEQAATLGQHQNTINALRELYSLLPSALESTIPGALLTGNLGLDGIDITWADNLKSIFNDPASIDALDKLFGGGVLGYTENAALMKELSDALVNPAIELTDEQRKQLEITQALLDLKMREQEIIDETMQRSRSASEHAALDLKNKQEEISFMMQANDLEKEKLSIQQQQMEFMGIQEGDLSNLSAAQAAAGIEFLKVYADNLGKDIAETQKAGMPTAQGALEQDALKAQANAFDQVLKAATKKPDPQLERSNKLLEAIREAIANGGTIQFVQ